MQGSLQYQPQGVYGPENLENWWSHKSQVWWPRWFLFVATWSHKVDQSWPSCISTCVNFLKSYKFFIIAIACGRSWNKADENKAHTSSGSMQVCKWTKQWALWVLHKDELCLSVQQYKQDDRMCQSLGESTGHMSGSMLCSSLPCCRGKNNRDGHWWWSQCVWKVPTFTDYMFLSKISVFIITLWLPWAAAVKL